MRKILGPDLPGLDEELPDAEDDEDTREFLDATRISVPLDSTDCDELLVVQLVRVCEDFGDDAAVVRVVRPPEWKVFFAPATS